MQYSIEQDSLFICFLIFKVISSACDAPRPRNDENRDVGLMLCEYYWWILLCTYIVLVVYGTNWSVNTVNNHSLRHCLSNWISSWPERVNSKTFRPPILLFWHYWHRQCILSYVIAIVLFREYSRIASSTFMGYTSKGRLGNGGFDGALVPLKVRCRMTVTIIQFPFIPEMCL